MIYRMKQHLNPSSYVHNLQKNFSRIRKLPFYTVIKMLIGMGGNSLGKELLRTRYML